MSKLTSFRFSFGLRRIAAVVLAITFVSWAAVGRPADPLNLKFDFSNLTYAPGPYVSLYNGGASSLSGSNIFVSFQAGTFSGTIGGTASLSLSSGTWTYTTTSSTTTYTSIMSQSFSAQELQDNGFQLGSIGAGRIIFSYGTNAYGYGASGTASVSPPGTPLSSGSTRYSVAEINYNAGNGVDLTNIDQFGGALQITARNSSNVIVASTGNTKSSQQFMTDMVNIAGGTTSPLVVMSGSQVASVTGPSVWNGAPSVTAAAYGDLQQYIGTVASGSGSTALKSPTLTNIIDNGFPGGLGAIAFLTSSTAGNSLTTGSNYQLGYSFTPTVTPSGTLASVSFTGSVSVLSQATPASGPVAHTYNGLTFTIASGSSMDSYLASGGPTSFTNIALSGSGWTQFSQDFANVISGTPGANATYAAPLPAIVGGSNSSNNAEYGQVIQKVMGDFQEAVTAGLYGNTMSGSYSYFQNNLTTPVSGTGTIGELTSAIWWQNPQFAYSNTDPLAKNLFANEVFPNTFVTGTGGFSASGGGVYGAPYDDRFGSLIDPALSQWKNTFPLPTDGGSLTINFFEGVPVPEPSAVALFAVPAATLGGLAWRRSRRTRRKG